MADNATASMVLKSEGNAVESAALMVLKADSYAQHMGSVLVGGTVMGQVTISGSIETFYAGMLLVEPLDGGDYSFRVGGDLRNLVVGTTIGTTDPDAAPGSGGGDGSVDTETKYYSHVNIEVGGRVGQIMAHKASTFSVLAQNTASSANLNINQLVQKEVEFRGSAGGNNNLALSVGTAFQQFKIFDDFRFFNDSIETSQLLGTVSTGVTGEDDIIRVSGTLREKYSATEGAEGWDDVDYYGIALLAGQVIAIRMTQDGSGAMPIGVYDPDGRLIASEYNPLTNSLIIKADRPGIYNIAVGAFNEQLKSLPSELFTYEFEVEGAGTVTLGGMDLRGVYYYEPEGEAFTITSGDFGAMRVVDAVTFDKPKSTGGGGGGGSDEVVGPQFNDISVYAGNLRAIQTGSLGNAASANGGGLNMQIGGHVGLVSASEGALAISDSHIGGNVQMIAGVDAVFLRLDVDGGIGNIHAGSMPTVSASNVSYLHVNHDNIGRDGIIDLIDVQGDLGTEMYGGVQITTGTGGNVRYMRVGGTVYQDAFFAGGNAGIITGTTVNVVDDSGASVKLQATGSGSSLEVITYGIRGSGGSVIVRVTTSKGLTATSSTSANGNAAEISEIIATNTSAWGNEIIVNPLTGKVTLGRSVPPTDIIISGNSPLDVFSIVGTYVDNIRNTTEGELVNVRAISLGLLYAAGNIGLAKESNGTAVLSREVMFDTYPFMKQRNGIGVGDVGTVQANGAIANVIADMSFGQSSPVSSGIVTYPISTGTIGRLLANADKKNNPDLFEGIAGAIYAMGDIFEVNIGEGVAASGTGYGAAAGIFAGGNIGKITNQGLGSDIRGTIAAGGSIGDITLTDGGSIIDTLIAAGATLEETSFQHLDPYTINVGSTLGKITLTGNGGILGTTFRGYTIGDVSVRKGFGILNSSFNTPASGSLGNFYADGYGIRNVYIGDGVSTGNITAGQRSDEDLSIGQYTASVRPTEFDPDAATFDNDLESALSIYNPSYQYKAGLISTLVATGTLDLGKVSAYAILDTTLNYANTVKSIVTDENIENLSVTSGRLDQLATGSKKLRGDVLDSDFTISGDIGKFIVYGEVYDTHILTNNNGTIKTFEVNKVDGVGGDLAYSTITVAGRVNTIKIDGDIDNSDIVILSGSTGAYALNKLILNGSFISGNLEFQDDVNAIEVAGSFGQLGDALVIQGGLKSLVVGKDKAITGVEMGLDLFVLGDVGKITVRGQVLGDITVRGQLGTLAITADTTQVGSDILQGNVSVTETLKTITITDGNVSGMVYAGRDLSSFTIKNGSFTSSAVAGSVFGKLGKFTVSGDMDGLVSVASGELSTLTINGDMGDEAQIFAQSAKTITIKGQMKGGAGIFVETLIKTLSAGYIGSTASAATIIAGGVSSLSTKGIKNVNAGDLYADLSLGDTGKAAKLAVAGNLGGTAVIEGDLNLTIKGDLDMDVLLGDQLLVTGNVASLKVGGDLSGALVVKGSVKTLSADSVTDAIITVGLDVNAITVKNAIDSSLIQVGLWAGDDLQYTSVDGQQDLGEQARRSLLKKLTAGSLADSVIAAGGNIDSITVRGAMAASSVSAGLSVGSLAINQRLAGVTDGDTLRSQDGRELLAGSIKSFAANAINDSYVTAGVDAGDDGDFVNPSVLVNNANRPLVDGGGISVIGSVKGATNAGARILADSGIAKNNTTGLGAVFGNVTYDVADLVGASALPASVGVAAQGSPLVYTNNGLVVTITVKGPGSVEAFDASLADNILDALVITGSTSSTTVDIKTSNPGSVNIGRVLAGDDATLKSFTFDGSIVGDGTGELDVWFDGGVATLALAGLGDNDAQDRLTGVIGGDIKTLTLGSQDQGVLRVGGTVGTLNLTTGSGDPLQFNHEQYAGRSFSSITVDNGQVWAYESGRIYTIDPLNGGGIVESHNVTDAALGTGLTILGMDIQAGTGDLYAVSQVYNYNPTVYVGPVTADLQGLAVRSDGAVFAVRHDAANHVDQLVRINPQTGSYTVIGTLQDVFGNTYGTSTGSQVMSLAFNGNTLLAILTDREAAAGGSASVAADIAIAAIATTANGQGYVRVTNPNGNVAMPPVLLGTNGGEVYSGMTVNSVGHVYAVRNDNEVVRITPSTGADVALSSVTFAGLSLVGIGFDKDDNLIGLDSISDQLYHLDTDLGVATALSSAQMADGLTTFTVATTGGGQSTVVYAYDDIDNSGDDRAFYTNPGVVATLGLLDPTTGQFTQLQPLAIDAAGTPLAQAVVSLVFDSANSRVKVLTSDGVLHTYNTDGSVDLGTPPLTLHSTNGSAFAITRLDFHADGRLLGINDLGKQVVIIDQATGEVSNLTEAGSITGDVTAFAIDESTGQALVFNNQTKQVASLMGYNQQSLNGLSVSSASKVSLGDGYAARLAATTGGVKTLAINGDFAGSLSSVTDINSLAVANGAFSGSVYTGGSLAKASFKNADFTAGALLWADGKLSLDVAKGDDHAGLLNGAVVAGHLVKLDGKGEQPSDAQVIARRQADTISLAGDFSGAMDLASLTKSLAIKGKLLADAGIIIHDDASTITLGKGAQAGSLVAVEGAVKTLKVGETFAGVIGIRDGLGSATFDILNKGLLAVGLDTGSVKTGDVIASVMSFGTWFGQDHAYNTDDDLITGGIVKSVNVGGHYRDSITAVGVLPSYLLDGFTPGVSSNYAFLGNTSATNVQDISPAEAGGLVASSIDSFTVKGEIVSTSVPTGKVAGLVAADNIGKVNVGQTGNILRQRVYTDPFGPVQVDSVVTLSDRSFEIILTEPINTATLKLYQDLDFDNNVSVGDIIGSIVVFEGNGLNERIINNAVLNYTTRVINNVLRSVITVTAAQPFLDQEYGVAFPWYSFDPTQADQHDFPVVTDRSGLRSALMLVGDPFGTVITGDL